MQTLEDYGNDSATKPGPQESQIGTLKFKATKEIMGWIWTGYIGSRRLETSRQF